MLVKELMQCPYPVNDIQSSSRFDYLLDRWGETVENWNRLENILNQFSDDHNLLMIPVAWIFDDFNLDENTIYGCIRNCRNLLYPNLVPLSMFNDVLDERKQLLATSNTADLDLKAVIEFMQWLLTVPEDIREFYHKVYDHDHDEWYIDLEKLKT